MHDHIASISLRRLVSAGPIAALALGLTRCALEPSVDSPPVASAASPLCSGLAITPSPAGPSAIGTPIALGARSACAPGETAQYSFLARVPGATAFTVIRGWNSSSQATWSTAALGAGIHTLRVEVRRQGQTAVDARVDRPFELVDRCTGVSLVAAPASPRSSGTPVTLTAQAACGTLPVEHEFAQRAGTSGAFTVIRPFASGNSAVWNTGGLASGNYTLRVRSRRAGTTSAVSNQIPFRLDSAPAACNGEPTLPGVAYATTHARTVLDLYFPPTGSAVPLIVWIHGGGWQNGDRTLPVTSQARARLMGFCERGYAIASLDYRLSQDAIFPAQIHDVKAAIRFLRANAASLRLDPSRFAVWGFSAGAHLASLLGTSAGVATLEDFGQGNAGFSSAVQAIVECSGPIDLPAMDRQLLQNGCLARHDRPESPESVFLGCTQGLQIDCPQAVTANPITHVDASDPPFLIGTGEDDCNVPFQQALQLRAELVGAGVQASAQVVPNVGHELLACPSDTAIADFLSAALN